MAMSTLEQLRMTIAALMYQTGEKPPALAAGIGMSSDKVNRRQNGETAWSFDEADAVAAHYGIDPLDLLAGPTRAGEALPADRREQRRPAAPRTRTAKPATAPVPAEPETAEPAVAEPRSAAATAPDRADAGPCVLCGHPASNVVEGFPQHLDPADCAQSAQAPAHPHAAAAAAPASASTEPPAPAAATEPGPSAPDASRPARATPQRPRSRGTTSTDQLPVDEIHQVVVAEATNAGGDIETATAALVKRAIPDAMALWHLTRKGGNYDVLFRPPRPDILKKRTKMGPDDIWEARPKWRNKPLLSDKTGPAREVTVLDINGAYLAAMKAHLPHKQLEHDTSGTFDRRRSGVYLITPPEWPHEHLPNPLGARDTPGELWITDATLRLLLRASSPKFELCEPPTIHEAWTAASSESLLDKFRATLAAVREEAIANDDAMTLEYVKAMYSKFVSTCGESTHNREIERPEWMHIIHSQAFANLWWKAYKAHEAGLTLVEMAGTDELHVTGGDWRKVFAEGRGLSEVKVKNIRTLGGGS